MNGRKLDPGCRQAWVAWLNLLRPKSNPPTRERIAPVLRVDGQECGLDFGHLHDAPVVLFILLHADDRPAAQALVGRGLFIDHARREFEASSPVIVTTSPPRR